MNRQRVPSSTASTSSKTHVRPANNINNVNRSAKKPKSNLTKPAWDDSLTAGTVPATKPNESTVKNKIDLQKKQPKKSILKLDAKERLALLKEILFEDDQVKSILQESDNVLKNDKFLTLDSSELINRKQANIVMTLAPNVSNPDDSILPCQPVASNKQKKASNVSAAYTNNANSFSSVDEHDTKKPKDEFTNQIEKCLKLFELSKNLLENNKNEELNKKEPVKTDPETELKRSITALETKLSEFEKQIGKQDKFKLSNSYSDSTPLSSLVHITSSMFDYTRDLIAELNYEKKKRIESDKQLDINRKLIDGLTTEILNVKQQNENIIEFNSRLKSEVDQIKLILRTSAFMPVTHMPPRPPIPPPVHQFSPEQSQFKPPQHRPSSCMPSINDPVLYSNKSDKFTERLNAMLLYDLPKTGLFNDQSKMDSFSESNLKMGANSLNSLISDMENVRLNGNPRVFRPLSAFSDNVNNSSTPQNLNSLINSNKKMMNEFSNQILDLSTKNQIAEQKLKQLQNEHEDTETKQSKNDSVEKAEKEDDKHVALNRLKQRQQSIKDQINMLNMQRDMAKRELEKLASMPENSDSNPNVKTIIQNTINQQLESYFESVSNGALDKQRTPSVSPIHDDNVYH